MRQWMCSFGVLAALGVAAPAPAALIIDPLLSSLTPAVGPSQSLSGFLSFELGAQPPLASNTTLDMTDITAIASGGLAIALDPALANPGAGVLSPTGSFLIPNLFLRLSQGLDVFDLTVPNVLGQYGALPGCPAAVCLATEFDIDTGGPQGIVHVEVFATPEPGTAALVAGGLLALAGARRRGMRDDRRRGMRGVR